MGILNRFQFADAVEDKRWEDRARNKQINNTEHTALEPRTLEEWDHNIGECSFCHPKIGYPNHQSIVGKS